MFSFKNLLKVGLFLTLFGLAALVITYFLLRSELPSVESLKNLQWQTPMKIYSADGQLMNQFGEKKRIPLTLDEMPKQLINAILATEDDRFYLHFGVDPIGMTRAVIGQLIGQNKGGASTITMQVARNFFLTREQTYIRKIREIFTAFHIEYLLSKDEILALYMNKIPLGHRSFGFGAAAQVYYNKDVKDLTLAQIAVLAGLPKAPSTLNPISRPDRALSRRAVVLQRMLVTDYITREEFEQAINAPITAKKHGAIIELSAPYAAEMAHQEMIDRYGKEQAYTGGYKVFTTVTSKLQKSAEHAVISNLLNYDLRHGYRGPIMSLRPQGDQHEEIEIVEIDPLNINEIEDALSDIESYPPLFPAVVTKVEEQSIEVTLPNNQVERINWQGLSWAREYINDDKQGPAPQFANEIVKYADVVYVRQQGQQYALSQFPSASSALVSLSPDNGAIKAVVGGFSYKHSQFNRVTQAKRQVGSNIKPFVYSAALENGFTLASIVNDAPINQSNDITGVVWRPKNSPAIYSGEIRVKRALAQSKNVVAVRLFREVGLNKIIPHLASFGFAPDELPRDESLSLGSASLTPMEVATGFATFANNGFLIEPYIIERIEDSFGNIVYQANPAIACDDCSHFDNNSQLTADLDPIPENIVNTLTSQQSSSKEHPLIKAERVISPQNAFLITQALNEAIWGADWSINPGWQGTGFRGRTLKRRDIAGKTGTTNEAKDAWFSGYSRRIVTTSWIGFDDPSRNLGSSSYNKNLDKNQITGKEFGAKSAQPAWISFMRTALADLPVEPFMQPENIVSVRIDKQTGKLTKRTDRTSIFEYFKLGTAPTEYVTKDNSHDIFDNKTQTEEIF
ncbi:penicillin-binding protein 1A [Thalassotalea castellviae]|uniref:Penicillin-binding protein 1A n=1 Tax=Thalassotalea castellviae TaxID=3075612 RepID=A0ABU3A1I1_9GAMM|nr:penicillin-binding protein 1A [Thalassotalea sp. W431]MDT0603738.1 penicillin-binding protein 1A [Thalassotalea sp. W431]